MNHSCNQSMYYLESHSRGHSSHSVSNALRYYLAQRHQGQKKVEFAALMPIFKAADFQSEQNVNLQFLLSQLLYSVINV